MARWPTVVLLVCLLGFSFVLYLRNERGSNQWAQHVTALPSDPHSPTLVQEAIASPHAHTTCNCPNITTVNDVHYAGVVVEKKVPPLDPRWPFSAKPQKSESLAVKLIVLPFGWTGKWHPLYNAGFDKLLSIVELEILASTGFRLDERRVNVQFDVVEPFNLPFVFKKYKSEEALLRSVAKRASFWDFTLTLCPFTASWVNYVVSRYATPYLTKAHINTLNASEAQMVGVVKGARAIHLRKAREAVFYPVDGVVPPQHNRTYDVMLASSKLAADYLHEPAQRIKKFNYVLLKKPDEGIDEVPTHKAPIPHPAKMALYAQSKAAIVWNCYAAHPSTTTAWRRVPLRTHPVFGSLDWDAAEQSGKGLLIPQLKSRTFEAALAGCILLSMWDPWGLIEQWFEPEKEFLYWRTPDELEALIGDIRANYSKYKHIGEAAQQRVLNSYTAAHFVKRYLTFVPQVRRAFQ